MTDKILKSADFQKAEVFGCGLDYRDPQRGYRKPCPVEETEIAQMLYGKGVSLPTQTLGQER